MKGKHSIARKVTRRVSLLLLIAMAVLFIGSLKLVTDMIYNSNQRYALALLGVFTDLLTEDSEVDQIPVDAEHPERVIRYGEYICDWYNVDYVYLYVPDVSAGTVTYIAAAYADSFVQEAPENHMIGHTADHVLTEEELAVWNGEQFSAQITNNNQYGHEVTTVMRMEDAFGNRALAGLDIAYSNITRQIARAFAILAAIILFVLFGVYIAVYLIIRKQVSRPARLLSDRMQDFLTDGKREDVKLPEGGSDEYAGIASAFNRMSDNIDRYVADIGDLTREQTNRQAELDIAARIQRGFLPAGYREYPDCEIRAVMTPAKDVGGDLYDYFPLDDHRTLIVVADVSGKGVSAAMFMSVTLILIRQYAKMGLAPDEILRRTNDTLSEKNAAMLFATAFVGIYDSEAGTFTYSNAGHDRPYILGETLTKLEDACGILLGLFPGETYRSASVPLSPGDTVFLYTDGVSEAADGERRFFGLDRLEAALREARATRAEDPVAYIGDAIRAFSGGAEAHDDITMLALTARNAITLSLKAELTELTKIKAAVLALPLPRPRALNLCLSAEECFVNICSYAFEEMRSEEPAIHFTVAVSDRITMRFEDNGSPYNPLEQVTVPEDYDLDTRIGGLGKFISFSIADEVRYDYQDSKNILTLIKYFEEDAQ